MDLTESIAPRSDQVNADDLVGGPITYTIREVIQGKAEQPFDFLLVETDRAYSPLTAADVLRHEWKRADPERRKVIEAEVAAAQGGSDA